MLQVKLHCFFFGFTWNLDSSTLVPSYSPLAVYMHTQAAHKYMLVTVSTLLKVKVLFIFIFFLFLSKIIPPKHKAQCTQAGLNKSCSKPPHFSQSLYYITTRPNWQSFFLFINFLLSSTHAHTHHLDTEKKKFRMNWLQKRLYRRYKKSLCQFGGHVRPCAGHYCLPSHLYCLGLLYAPDCLALQPSHHILQSCPPHR